MYHLHPKNAQLRMAVPIDHERLAPKHVDMRGFPLESSALLPRTAAAPLLSAAPFEAKHGRDETLQEGWGPQIATGLLANQRES
jgi:hypothetical protein